MPETETQLKLDLEAKSRDELNVLGKRLNVSIYRRLKKDELVEALLACPLISKHLRVTWWDLHHNHVYGAATIVGLILAVVFFVWPVINTSTAPGIGSIAQYNQYGSLSLNLKRRNSLQNIRLNEWVDKTRAFKTRYLSNRPPSKQDYEQFIAEFTEFAESTFTPLQIKSFQGLESGAGGEMFRGADKLTGEHEKQFVQLALIEYWLLDYIDLNRKGEEPMDPDKMSI